MTTESPKSPEELRADIVAELNVLKDKYDDYADQLEELVFYLEEEMLGNNQPYLLTIGKHRLKIKRNEKEVNMLAKVEKFVSALKGTNPISAETSAKVSEVVEPMTEGKDATYWRDITVGIVSIKRAFLNTPFGNRMDALRRMIHEGKLGKEAFAVKYKGLSLDIKKGDDELAMKSKLAVFVKAVQRKFANKFKPTQEREGIEEPEDRKKIWSVIMAGLVSLKKAFADTDFGYEIAEIKDLIEDYKLGSDFEYQLDTEWGISLDIKKGEDLNEMVQKLTQFIEAVQKANPERFKEKKVVSAKKAVEQKESEKIYWQDVIAGLDVLQKDYPAKEYPAIQKLKDMIENDELAHGSSLLLNVGPVVLDINAKNNDKTIKNKIAVFIGALKQVAPVEEELTETYWRDLLSQLHGMEEAYGDNPDYQMLIMTIEMGTLATVRDFQVCIEGASLDITIQDSDGEIKGKLSEFIKELKGSKQVKIDQKAVKGYKERIKRLEKQSQQIESKYKGQLKKVQGEVKDAKVEIRDKNKQIKRLQDELADAKKARQSISRPSYSG